MAQLIKGWMEPASGQKKFIASVLAYELSKKLDRARFEVVNESFIDIHDIHSEQPDVVVYDKAANYRPSLIIECVNEASRSEVINTLEVLRNIYNFNEAFVYDIDRSEWYKVSENVNQESLSGQFLFSMEKLLSDGLQSYMR